MADTVLCDAPAVNPAAPPRPPGWRRFWRAETGIFLGLWLALLTAGSDKLFGDPGTFWHTVVGRQMIESGRLIHSDPFSFTRGGQPWIAQQWLGECAMAAVHHVAGLDGLLLATATFLAGLWTWVAHRMIRSGVPWLLAVLFTMLAVLASSYHFHPRPHLINLALLGVTFAWLCDFEGGRVSLARLFWLVPLYVLWTNVHGGMVGGVATLALAVAGWSGAALLGRGPLAGAFGRVVPLALLVAACGLTVFVNPYGLRLPQVWFALMGSPVLPQLMIEHAPLRHAGAPGLTVLLFGLVYLAVLAGVPPRQLRVTWLIPLAWMVMAWSCIRHGPLFAVVAALAVADMYPHVRWVGWLSRHGSQVFRVQPAGGRAGWAPALIPAALVALAVVLQVAGVRFPVVGRGWVRLEPAHWPVDLLPELRAYEASRPGGTPVFNDMLFGGFLIYHTPGLRVFIDDRCELYGDQGLVDYAFAIGDDPSQVDRWAEQYGFDLALVTPGSGFDRHLRGAAGWTLTRECPAAVLYRREPSPRGR